MADSSIELFYMYIQKACYMSAAFIYYGVLGGMLLYGLGLAVNKIHQLITWK